MNSFLTVALLGLLVTSGPRQISSLDVLTSENSVFQGDKRTVHLIDKAQSILRWKGTKLMGAGSHEGTVDIQSGELIFEKNRLVGGEIVVDMRTIYVTDIPLTDPIPRKNLTTHLNEDFLTDVHHQATFVIREVSPLAGQKMEITGEMMIRAIRREMIFHATAEEDNRSLAATISFDRFDFGVGEDGSWLEKKMVDPEVVMEVQLTLQKQ